MRKLISITALAAVAVLAFAVPASAADRTPGRGGSGSPGSPALPPGVDTSRWPTFLKGSTTNYRYEFIAAEPPGQDNPCAPYFHCGFRGAPSLTTIDRSRVPDLKLKRARVKVMRSSVQVVYRIVDGTVTWSHEQSRSCEGVVELNFVEKFSLEGAKWGIDDRITFFAPKTGRYKNRWRVDGSIGLVHDRQMGICTDTYPNEPALTPMPPPFGGMRVGAIPPVARPGRTVRLSSQSNYVCCGGPGSSTDHREVLAIRIPR
jgi:hypothetical protein